jgi:hypothetical protein
MYNFISYEARDYYFFEEHVDVPDYQVGIDYEGYWVDIGRGVHHAVKEITQQMSAKQRAEYFSDSNGFLMSSDYYDYIFAWVEELNRVNKASTKTAKNTSKKATASKKTSKKANKK